MHCAVVGVIVLNARVYRQEPGVLAGACGLSASQHVGGFMGREACTVYACHSIATVVVMVICVRLSDQAEGLV